VLVYSRPSRLIITQYTRPPFMSLVAAAELLGAGKQAVAAQVVDLAVRRVISISRAAGAGRRSGFVLTLIRNVANEGLDEQAFLATLFGPGAAIGSAIRLLPGRNRELGAALREPHRYAVGRLVVAGLARETNLALKLLMPWRRQPVAPTERAYPIVDHLWGVRDYIKLAEKDRFAMLQSPEGAERTRLNALDVLRLNEKLLPFAVLFGLEKQWMKELDLQYRSLPAEAYAGFELTVDLPLDGMVQLVDLGDLFGEIDLSELGDVVDAAGVLDGVGAIFGGIAEFIGSLSP
jgi:hypothetical protein